MVMMAKPFDKEGFDQEVAQIKSRAKDFFSYYFREYVYPVKVTVPVPIVGTHTLTPPEKREIEKFLLESIDTAEPLPTLVLAKKAEMIFKRQR